MDRFLVVDDMEVRHEEFRRLLKGAKVDHANNVHEAILAIQEGMFASDRGFFKARRLGIVPPENWVHKVIFLDHDIDNGDDRRDVIHLVYWILRDPILVEAYKKKQTVFFIHSWNDVGSENMKVALERAGLRVHRRPFTSEKMKYKD